MYRHVELVAVRVLKVQKLSRDIAYVQRNQAQVPADTVVGVDDRRTGLEVVELPDDRFRIPLGASPPASLLRFLAEQLMFADDCQRAVGQHHAVFNRCHGNGDPLIAIGERRPVIDPCGMDTAALVARSVFLLGILIGLSQLGVQIGPLLAGAGVGFCVELFKAGIESLAVYGQAFFLQLFKQVKVSGSVVEFTKYR